MLHTNNPIIKHKAGLLNLAEELAQDGNLDALINRSRRTPNIKNRVDDTTKNAVIDYAIAEPAHGQHRTSNELRKKGVFVSGSGVRSICLRHGLENFKKRLKALEQKVAEDGIVLTDAQVAALEKRKTMTKRVAR